MKKIIIFPFLIIFSVSLGNNNLFKIYLYLKEYVLIQSIKQEKLNICQPLQQKIETIISNYRRNISISVLKDNGDFIVDINSKLPRIPASNQKLLSSAFSLNQLGPYFTLDTSLKLLSDGSFFIDASGDPDLDVSQLSSLILELKKGRI